MLIGTMIGGFKIKNFKLASYAWLFNLIFSFVIYYGLYNLLVISATRSMVSYDIDYYNFFTFITDIINNFKAELLLLISLAILVAVGYFLVSVFISSGIYAVLINDEITSFLNLINSSCRNFFKLLKVFLLNLLNWLFMALISGGIFLALFKILPVIENKLLINIFFFFWLGISMILLIIAVAVYDFSRIIRLKEERNFFFSFKEGMKFVFSHKVNILVFFLIYFFAVVFLHVLFSVIFSNINFFNVILFFCLYQVFIWFKYYLKITVMQIEINMLESNP